VLYNKSQLCKWQSRIIYRSISWGGNEKYEEHVGEVKRLRSPGEDFDDNYMTITRVVVTSLQQCSGEKIISQKVIARDIYSTAYSGYIWDDESKKYIGVNAQYTQHEHLDYDANGNCVGGTATRSYI